MPLRYVSFSYLSKVKAGGKVMHWTLTLSQDSCSRNEPMHPTHLSSLLLSCPYLKIGLGNWVGGNEENANYRVTYANIFLSVGLSFLTMGSSKYSSATFVFYYFSISNPCTRCLRQV